MAAAAVQAPAGSGSGSPGTSTPPPEPGGGPISNDLYGAAAEIDALDDGQGEGAGEGAQRGEGGGTDTRESRRSGPKLEDGRGENPEGDLEDEGKPNIGQSGEDLETEIASLDEKQDRDGKETEKEGETGKEGKAKDGEEPERFTRTKDLKNAYEKLKAEHRTLTEEHTKTRTEVERLSRANPDEVKALREQLEKAETRRTELESKLRDYDYRESEEYKSKYERPLLTAWEKAAKDLRELTIETPEGTTRPADVNDLLQLANMPLGEARRLANQLFGDAANDVMLHRKTILDLNESQSRALEDAKKSAAERAKTKTVEERQRAEKLTSLWEAENKGMVTKWPKMFGKVKEDPEGNAILDKGMQEVDRLLIDPAGLSDEERLRLTVRVRHKAANHDRLALRVKRLGARIAALNKELEGYRKAEPPGGRTGRRGGSNGHSSTDVWTETDKEIASLDDGTL